MHTFRILLARSLALRMWLRWLAGVKTGEVLFLKHARTPLPAQVSKVAQGGFSLRIGCTHSTRLEGPSQRKVCLSGGLAGLISPFQPHLVCCRLPLLLLHCITSSAFLSSNYSFARDTPLSKCGLENPKFVQVSRQGS